MRRFRLAVLASHPIQYQAPMYRALAARPESDLTVFFCEASGVKPYLDEGFGQSVHWDIPLLDGYRYEMLRNLSPSPNASRFFGVVNPGIVSRLRNGNWDAVWINGWDLFTYWLAFLTAASARIPILLRAETNLLARPAPWKKPLKRAVLSCLFRNVSAFLAIGRCNAEFYQAYGVPNKKIVLVPYAVDNDFFLAKARELVPRKAELKKAHGIPPDLPVILFSGKLSKRKEPHDLLRAYAEVSSRFPSALVFAGSGEEADALRAFAESSGLKHVYFLGFQNQSELPACYAMADLLALPSSFEPWGLVVNEAMCFGLPVLASDQVGAAGDLIKPDINGYLFPVQDVRELSDRLAHLLSSPDLRARMGQASLEIIRPWSYETGIGQVVKCLEGLGKGEASATCRAL